MSILYPSKEGFFNLEVKIRITFISACTEGFLSCFTVLCATATISPSFTITVAYGATFSATRIKY
jgi:hypothetical protein